MPGGNISTAPPLSEAELTLPAELVADVQTLARKIGKRTLLCYAQLNAAADFIEVYLARAGFESAPRHL